MYQSQSVNEYLAAESAKEQRGGGGIVRKFTNIDVNGKTGRFKRREPATDEQAKNKDWPKWEELDIASFEGVILRVAYFAQSAYVPNAATSERTREFTDFKTEAIELLEKTWGKEGTKTESAGVYANWQAFKDATTVIDPRKRTPMKWEYRLSAALYVLTDKGNVVRYEVSGKGLSHLFKYLNEYKSSPFAPMAMKQCVTKFGVQAEKNDMGIEFFAQTLDVAGLCDEERMAKVMAEDKALNEWADSWGKPSAKSKDPTYEPANDDNRVEMSSVAEPREIEKRVDEMDFSQPPF